MNTIADLEQRAAELAAAAAGARDRLSALQNELRAVNARWQGATLDTVTALEFAELTARRELLDRAMGPVRTEYNRADEAFRAARTALAVKTGQRRRALDQLARAEAHGNTHEADAARRVLAGLEGNA